MLEVNQAQVARNVKLYSRELRNWRGPLLVHDPDIAGAQSFYQLDNGSAPIWLAWTDVEVDVAPGPVADLTEARIYYTGSGTPKKTNHALAQAAGAPYPSGYYEMGVPAPVTAPTVTAPPPATSTYYLNIQDHMAMGDSGSASGTLTVTSEPVSVAGNDNTTGNLAMGLSLRDTRTDAADGGNTGFFTDSITISRSPTALSIVTFPTTAPVAAPETYNTAAPDTETRAYVYTFVAQFGSLTEESAPSPPSNLITGEVSKPFTIVGIEGAPAGNYNITHLRIYRTVTGASTDSYQFVDEVAIGTSTYDDSLGVAALGEVLQTTGWLPPPEDMQGLVSLPFGALAGFSGNTIYFSEPYYPHAWPLAYALTVPFRIIGLGVIGASVVVMTDVSPYIIAGATPGALSVEQVPLLEPCVSRRSIAADDQGVIYASPNGLVSIGYNTRGVITASLYKRDEWQTLNPALLAAVMYDNKYIGIFAGTSNPALVISRDDTPALSFVDLNARALWVEPNTAALHLLSQDDEQIYQVDADPDTIIEYTWRSKRFSLPKGITFTAVKIDAAFDQLSEDRTLEMKLYGDDDELIETLTVDTWDPIRLPPFRCREMMFELTGEIDVRSIAFATTIEELRE